MGKPKSADLRGRATRNKFDRDLLGALSRRNHNATYVLRNHLDWPGEPWHKTGLTTAQVLAGCRRLEKQGLAEQYHQSSYVVMLSWSITDAGRQALEANQ